MKVFSWYDFAEAIVNEAGISCKIVGSGAKTFLLQPLIILICLDKVNKETYSIEIPHWNQVLKLY